MRDSSALAKRKSATRGLNVLAAGGIVLVLATAATAITFAGNANNEVKLPVETHLPG